MTSGSGNTGQDHRRFGSFLSRHRLLWFVLRVAMLPVIVLLVVAMLFQVGTSVLRHRKR